MIRVTDIVPPQWCFDEAKRRLDENDPRIAKTMEIGTWIITTLAETIYKNEKPPVNPVHLALECAMSKMYSDRIPGWIGTMKARNIILSTLAEKGFEIRKIES